MHICFVTREYPPETGWGGVAAYAHDAAHGLAAAGHRVSVVSLAKGAEAVRDDGPIAVHRVRAALDLGETRLVWRTYVRLGTIWPGFSWAAARRVRSIHRQSPIDVVETPGTIDGLFLGRGRDGLHHVCRIHGPNAVFDQVTGARPDWQRRILYRLEARAVLNADAWTLPSRNMLELAAALFRIDATRAHVIENPIDTASYVPREAPSNREVLVVGRLERRKGFALLADVVPTVLRACPEASFRFIGQDHGDGQGRSWAALIQGRLSSDERARVHFERLSRDEIRSRYQSTCVYLCASLWENGPYSILEAMAAGLPVVATNVGGIPEMISNGDSGLLVPPEPERLAGALLEILRAEDLGRRMGRAARQRAEQAFDVRRVIPRMIEVYRGIVRGSASSG